MKGAKGGKRDQLISNHFSELNSELEEHNQEDLEKAESSFKFKAEKKKNSNENRVYEDKIKSLEKEKENASVLMDDDITFEQYLEQKGNEKEEVEEQVEEEVIEDKKQEETRIIQETQEEIKEISETKEKELEELEEQKKLEEEKIVDSKEAEQKKIKEKLEETVDNEEEITISSEEENKLQEAMVFYELQKMIREDYYDIKELEYKIDILSTKAEQEVLKEEIEKLKKELEELLKQFNALKDKYDYLDIGKNLAGIHSLNSEYIENVVENYKKGLKESTELENLIQQMEQTKEYIGVVETLIITEEKKDTLEQKLDEKCEEYGIRDEEFASLEDMAIDVEKVNEEVAKCSKEIENTTKILEAKVREAVQITTRRDFYTELVPHVNRALNATLMLATSTMMPHNFIGNIMKASLIAGAINNMAHVIEPEQRVREVKTVSYTDYSKDIVRNMQNIRDVYKMVDDALDNIYDIEDKFNKEFKEYEGLIPGYKELVVNMDKIKGELEEQQYLMKKYDNNLKEQYNKNNSKKYIKEYELNNA